MSDDVRVWVNGALVEATSPAIAALDHGVTVGDGVFETCKVADGRGFALTRHARRLDRSLAGSGLPAADHDRTSTRVWRRCWTAAPIEFGRLRYTRDRRRGAARVPTAATRRSPTSSRPARSPGHPRTRAVVVVPWTRNERCASPG